MVKKILLLFPLLLIPGACQAIVQNLGNVVINEIAWMGSKTSANDEWMELKNTTNQDINLAGWTLKSVDEKIKITLKGFVVAQGYFLMERTDDNSLPTIPADMLYTGALNNNGQYLKLYDSSNNVIDQANFPAKWPAGDNTTKQTMERSDGGWQTSKNEGGTPRAQNSPGAARITQPSQDPMPAPAPNPTPQTPPLLINDPAAEIVYSSGVIISEILPAPEGADQTNEWVELQNTTAFSIDIFGWKLQDSKGTPTTYIFPSGTTMAANSYLIARRPDTKITLNNEEDGLDLLWPNGNSTHSVLYTSAPTNQSYNMVNGDWKWSTTKTPGDANIVTIPIIQVKASKKTAKALPTTKKTDSTYVAALSGANMEAFSNALHGGNTLNPWLLFLIAMGITIAAAGIVLVLKLKIFKKKKDLEVM